MCVCCFSLRILKQIGKSDKVMTPGGYTKLLHCLLHLYGHTMSEDDIQNTVLPTWVH